MLTLNFASVQQFTPRPIYDVSFDFTEFGFLHATRKDMFALRGVFDHTIEDGTTMVFTDDVDEPEDFMMVSWLCCGNVSILYCVVKG